MALPSDPEAMMRFMGMYDAMKDWQKVLLEKIYKQAFPPYIVDPSKIDPDLLNFPKPTKAVFIPDMKTEIRGYRAESIVYDDIVEMGGMADTGPKKPKCDCPGCSPKPKAGWFYDPANVGQAVNASNPSAVIEKRTGHGQYTGGPT